MAPRAAVGIANRALIAVLACIAMSLLAAADANAGEPVTERFTASGAERSYVVPAGVTKLTVRAVGGTGRGGGAPAEASGEIAVAPGETLYVEVGGSPAGSAGGWNGGGAGGNAAAGGGGGASDLRTVSRANAAETLTSRLIVAGAGGGASSTGNAGGAAGAEGLPLEEGGKPGTQTAGGESEELWECWIEKEHEGKHEGGTPGELALGGEGEGCRSRSHGSVGGGGGGAGLYGGGGGGVEFDVEPPYEFASGGGGGSSLVPEDGSLALAQGAAAQVEITYVRHEPPLATSEPASAVGTGGATLNGSVDPQGSAVMSCQFEYGTSASYGSSVPCASPPGSGRGPVAVSAVLEGLGAVRSYHYRVVATSAEGTSYGGDVEFTTLARKPPVVATEPASGVGTAAAWLNATVDPRGSAVTGCQFEYGTSAFYENTVSCSSAPGADEGPVPVSVLLEGLSETTTYHYRVVATSAEGTSAGSDAEFTTAAHEPPSVSELAPSLGPETGGTTVTITGTELESVTGVSFGAVAATSVEHVSQSSLRAVTPPEAARSATVTLTDDLGNEVPAGTFRYVAPPVVTKVTPRRGASTGGTPVVIAGTATLADVREVRFGDTPAAFTHEGDSTLIATAPPHAVGAYEVTVLSAGGQSAASSNHVYKYAGIEVAGVSPASGPRAGGAILTVTGAGFAPGSGTTAFAVGKANATGVECASTTQCTMVAPAAARAGTVDVRASVPGVKGRSKKSGADRYRYE